MGVEYRLYHHPTRTYVHLGKGPWYVLRDALRWGQDVLELAGDLLSNWCSGRDDAEEFAVYALWILCRSVGFVETGRWSRETSRFEDVERTTDVRVLSDAEEGYWELNEDPSYRKVGERYDPPDDYTEEVEEIVGFLTDDLLVDALDEEVRW